MGPVAIDRRASSSLAELIASMSEDELGTAVPEAAPQLPPASLPAVSGSFAMPPAGDLTAESPPTPDAAAYGFSRGSTARRRVQHTWHVWLNACAHLWLRRICAAFCTSSEGHATSQHIIYLQQKRSCCPASSRMTSPHQWVLTRFSMSAQVIVCLAFCLYGPFGSRKPSGHGGRGRAPASSSKIRSSGCRQRAAGCSAGAGQ